MTQNSSKAHNIAKPATASKSGEKTKVTALDEMQKKLKECQAKAEEYLNGWKRAKADYLNLKKEFEKERTELIKFANAALILDLLPIYSHLEKAFKQVPEEQIQSAWVKGLSHIKKEFEDFLKNLGLEKIKSEGEKFNPEFHEAVEQSTEGQAPSGTIVKEVEPGFQMYGKVIKPAQVIVKK